MSFDPVEYEVEDIYTRMFSRFLLQFQESQVLHDILHVFSAEIQVLLDSTQGVVIDRTPLIAIQEQLEGIGRIVGQQRIVIGYTEVVYFTPDVPSRAADVGIAWVMNASSAGNPVLADDDALRRLIEAKVFRNFVKYGSVIESQTVAEIAFDTVVSFIWQSHMAVSIVVHMTTPLAILDFLTSVTTNKAVDRMFLMPYPSTLMIDSVILMPDFPFIPDTENVPDSAYASVGWSP